MLLLAIRRGCAAQSVSAAKTTCVARPAPPEAVRWLRSVCSKVFASPADPQVLGFWIGYLQPGGFPFVVTNDRRLGPVRNPLQHLLV